MGLLKVAILGLLLVIGVSWYVDELFSVKTAPVLPETWWRPGNEKTVSNEIRKFKISISDELIADLKLRLKNTRFGAEPLKGAGWSYGMSSKSLKEIIDYWLNKYDFKKREAVLNQYPQFITNIQGLDIHFLHVKPTNPAGKRVIPLLIQHGWPGSVVEFYKIIPLLTTPRPEYDFVFEIVAPSLPGYGFSEGSTLPGLGPAQIGVILKNLMLRLGHKQFYTQGGDWGAIVTSDMASMFPEHVLGIHLNMCAFWNMKTMFKTLIYSLAPSFFLPGEAHDRMFPLMKHLSFAAAETGYLHLQATKPDTIGAVASDTPAGLAAYILEKFSVAVNPDYIYKDDGGLLEKFTMDELLDNVMLYWVSNSFTTSVRLYSEAFSKSYTKPGYSKAPINVPASCAQFPHEIAYQPASLLKHRYKNLIRATRYDKGGHFAAMEEPDILAKDIWESINEMEIIRKTPKKQTK